MKNCYWKNAYMTVYSHCMSNCGNFVAAGNNYGEVAVFEYASFPSDKTHNKPAFLWSTSCSNVFAVASTNKHLFAAGDGPLTIWSWDPMYRGIQADPVATVDVLSRSAGYVNALALPSATSASVLCGCSDGSVVQIDPQTFRPKSTFLSEFAVSSKCRSQLCEVFCVSAGDENTFAAGTSDGRVLFWDAREANSPAFVLDVGREAAVRTWRPTPESEPVPVTKTSHQVSSIAIQKDWLLCGGTMDASLWHLGSRTMSATYSPDSSVGKILAVAISGGLDTILVAGQSPEVTAFRQDASVWMKMSTSSTCIYSLSSASDENVTSRIVAASGSSNKVNVYANFFRAFDFEF